MKNVFKAKAFAVVSAAAILVGAPTVGQAAESAKVGVVNSRKCIEDSKLGKQELENFEGMKKQMESTFSDKEKKLNELANKLNDADYLDSISPEAETELKREFRSMSQDLGQVQQQYYQTLQQANMKIMQKIAESIAKASEEVAKAQKFDLVLNEESSFYHSSALDITPSVVTEMDKSFSKENKK